MTGRGRAGEVGFKKPDLICLEERWLVVSDLMGVKVGVAVRDMLSPATRRSPRRCSKWLWRDLLNARTPARIMHSAGVALRGYTSRSCLRAEQLLDFVG